MDNNQLLELEQKYNFNDFSNEDALLFGVCVIEIIKEEKLKNIRIRVRRQGDIVFQYLMDDKIGEQWLNRKERTVLEANHSSLYVYHHQDKYPHMIDNDAYAICGGGFPLIENKKVTGVFCVSGLDHQEDHDVIIKGLDRMLERRKKQ